MNSTKITTGIDTKVQRSGSDRGSGVSDPTEGETTMNSPKRLARIAGVLYLLVGIFGGFAEGFVEPRMYVAGNAAATAVNVVANAIFVRLGPCSTRSCSPSTSRNRPLRTYSHS